MPSSGRGFAGAGAPNIDAGEQEEPHHVDEMPVPSGKFETQMLRRREMAEIGAEQADAQECRSNDHMRAMKPGRHEEGRAVDVMAEGESRVTVLVGLHRREGGTERNREDQAPFEALPIVLQ